MTRHLVYRWAEQAAVQIREELDLEEPPVDLELVAAALGVVEVRRRPLGADGRLEVEGGRTRVVLDNRFGPTRRRFTFAHELGHMVLARGESRALDLDAATRERFCDAFAAALLLPSDWLGRRARQSECSLLGLRAISREAEVSLASCLIALQRFPRWRFGLIQWRFEEGSWRQWSVSGVERDLRGQIASGPRTIVSLLAAAREGANATPCRLHLILGPREEEVEAEILVDGAIALALVDLPPAAEVLARGRFGELPPPRRAERVPEPPYRPLRPGPRP